MVQRLRISTFNPENLDDRPGVEPAVPSDADSRVAAPTSANPSRHPLPAGGQWTE
jgi:hypothetical protein